MLTLEETLAHLAAVPLPLLATERLPLSAALGRISAEACVARLDQPAFDCSAMDGYAISDLAERYRVTGHIAAGDAGHASIAAGEAIRILTGAPVPAGTHLVVPQEQVELNDNELLLRGPVKPGQHIRRRGTELAAGTPILAAGERLLPHQLGLLASQGIGDVSVYRRLRVGVFSTGNELQRPGEPLAPGQIYDANRPLLMALLSTLGCEVVDLGTVPDDLAATETRLRSASQQCDCLLSSGGASVGDADHVRAAVNALGAISHWKVAIKPGKPFAFGHVAGTPLLALPGNPVAAALTFQLLARPFLLRAAGARFTSPPPSDYPVLQDLRNDDKRTVFLRAIWQPKDGQRAVQPLAEQGSAALISLAQAEVLIELPAQSTVAAGDRVRCHALAEWHLL